MRLRFPQGPWLTAGVALAALLFFVANRGAYEGWFSDDDLDNLGWTTIAGFDTFTHGWLTPRFSTDNFRPTGHVMYRVLHGVFGMEFRPWVLVLQAIHWLNTAMVFFVCRRLGAPREGALGGAALFVFHPALFAAFWKPMYVFDLVCATFLLMTLLLYGSGWRLVASVASFWMAYKAKEVAIFFPLVLLLLHGFSWRLLPFFALSASFGLQAVVMTRGRESDYSLRFTVAAVRQCVAFYLWEAWYVPVALMAFARDRRVWLGLAAFAALVGPLWFLPGRLFAVYLYVPMIGLAVALAFALERVRPWGLAAMIVLWFGAGFAAMREFRKAELTRAQSNRHFYQQACASLRPMTATLFYEGQPPYMALHGVEAVLKRCAGNLMLPVSLFTPGQTEQGWLASWDGRALTLWPAGQGPWRLGPGWSRLQGHFRSMPAAEASLRLRQRPGDTKLYLRADSRGGQSIEIAADGRRVGEASVAGRFERSWTVPAGAAEQERQITVKAPLGLNVEELSFRP